MVQNRFSPLSGTTEFQALSNSYLRDAGKVTLEMYRCKTLIVPALYAFKDKQAGLADKWSPLWQRWESAFYHCSIWFGACYSALYTRLNTSTFPVSRKNGRYWGKFVGAQCSGTNGLEQSVLRHLCYFSPFYEYIRENRRVTRESEILYSGTYNRAS